MSDNDYIALIKKSNPNLAVASPTATVKIKAAAFEQVLRDAFNAGRVAAEEEKGLFERIFG
jgi:hypothetical protein